MRELDEAARRAYWTAQMDEAYAFMDTVCALPVAECGEPLVSLRQAVSRTGIEVVFSETLLAGVHPRLFYLRAGLIEGFLAAAREFNRRGLVLKVEDGYRTREMQRDLALAPGILDLIFQRVQWELGGAAPSPELLLRRLSALIATRPKVGTHMSGSAIDISVLRKGELSELDRGGPYPELSEKTPMGSRCVPSDARRNRAEITALMARHGFVAYPWEFWHYSAGDVYDACLRDRPEPARYGAVEFDPGTGRLQPLPQPEQWLHEPHELPAVVERLLAARV